MTHPAGQSPEDSLPGSKEFMVVTTGNDQLIKTWTIKVDASIAGAGGIRIQKCGAKCSEVADAACMDVIDEDKGTGKTVVVAGIGVEKWDIGAQGLARSID